MTAAGTLETALSIAGSDPTGGAGLQADLQVFRALGVHGAAVVTALTVQDSRKVHRVLPVFPSVVLDQLRVLLRDLAPRAVKVGMLANDDVVRNVILGLMELEDAVPVVVDPVLLASDGTPLLERRAWPSLRDLVSRAALVTPNLPEAEALAERDVSTRAATEDAARFLVRELGAGAALVKGGHRDGAPDDLLAVRAGDAVELEWLPGERIDIDSVHGTGCALSSAIAALLARGEPLRRAVAGGRVFVSEAIRRSAPASRAGSGGGARFLVYP
ncbi:MAG: bifunctional hydroxymethylpyrimidine kinase/phosphomethylpyrimidine kinase [Proteobacteria bacterium]|nr:bifunctional hydroxymethylpyrimidine kinase/phosphomethylpyrimidine kinase [Pseudomonadota bacterium]